jgi:hypothetical protein
VLVARPSIIDLGILVRDIFKNEIAADFTVDQAKQALERVKRWTKRMNSMTDEQKRALGAFVGEKIKSGVLFKAIGGTFAAANVVTLPAMAQVVGAIEQAAAFDWQSLLRAAQEKSGDSVIPLSALYRLDNAAIDRGYGICPIPLYELDADDWNSFLAAKDIDLIRERLKALGIYQYFYPPADQIALGAVERGLTGKDDVIEVVNSSPSAGHPLAPSELVPTGTQITEIVDALAERGFVTDIEQSVEVSPQGMQARIAIKTRPREGLISKLMTRFRIRADVKVRIDSTDILGPR